MKFTRITLKFNKNQFINYALQKFNKLNPKKSGSFRRDISRGSLEGQGQVLLNRRKTNIFVRFMFLFVSGMTSQVLKSVRL